MKNTVLSILMILLLTLLGCKSYEYEVLKQNKINSEKASQEAIKQFNAEDDIYSLLIFTHSFTNEKIIIKTEDEIINDSQIYTNRTNGLAKIIKVKNTKDIVICDNNFRVKIKSKLARTHKFIYVQKTEFIENSVGNDSIANNKRVRTKGKVYNVLYGNNILRFM